MKYFFYLLFILPVVFTQAQPSLLKNYIEIADALKEGYDVCVTIYYGRCRLIIDGKEEKSPDATGGMKINSYEIFAKGAVKNEKEFLTFSETVLISHPRYGYVNNYIKVRVYDDGNAEIIARYLDPKTLEVKMDETFYTSIYNGEEGGIRFYKK